MINRFELDNNLFNVGGIYVCVSDEKPKFGDVWIYISPINIVDYGENNNPFVYNTLPDSMNWFDNLHDKENYKKVIFSTKFIHESIPLLNLESEEDKVFKLASENILTSSGFVNTENEMDVAYSFYHNGYQKAKETFKYTEENLRKAFEAGNKRGWSGYPNTDNWTQPKFEEFIQSLQQPKEIKSIEVEYIRQERIEKLLSIPLERLTIIDDLGDKNCKNCSGYGCVDTGNDFGCTIDYCENCYPAETPIVLPNGKIKCKINY